MRTITSRCRPGLATALFACAAALHAAEPPAGDPMEHLRQRLADKLGAQPTGGRGANEIRVQTREKGTQPVPPKATAADRTAPQHTGSVSAPPAVAVDAPAHAGAAGKRADAQAAPAAGAPAPVIAAAPVHGARAPRPRSAAALPSTAGHGAHAGHWSYEGAAGPSAWGRLAPEYAQCANGSRQSPIDIRGGIAVQLEPVLFDYRPSAFGVIDNGHTVQVNVAPGNWIAVMGRRYELQQFHFHRPSEERIDGRQYDMVAHLVHRDAQGRLAVVAVLLEQGSAQPVVQTVWNNLPLERHEELAAPMPLAVDQLLPDDRRYFTYMGSLTTPPCSEGVLWMVMKKPVPVSPGQIAIFSRLYPMNARPVQSAGGRLIKESE